MAIRLQSEIVTECGSQYCCEAANPEDRLQGWDGLCCTMEPWLAPTNANTSGGRKKDVEPPKEVSNSNPFDVLNSVDNDDDLGINGGSSNIASNKANSSGSSFCNVGSSSLSTTPIAKKIDKIEKLIMDGQVTLVDDERKPVEKVDYSSDHDSENEVASTDNDMANFMAS
ncbi:hypothetical protein Tco_1209793 [Tanacetum coccineum]